jgi:transcriptional regulator NrdR family protein
MSELKVEKKGGQVVPFDRSKVSSGAVKSGASNEEAESIASKVEAWANETATDKVIKTSLIRGKVLEFLKAVNPEAAKAYEAYKKPTP